MMDTTLLYSMCRVGHCIMDFVLGKFEFNNNILSLYTKNDFNRRRSQPRIFYNISNISHNSYIILFTLHYYLLSKFEIQMSIKKIMPIYFKGFLGFLIMRKLKIFFFLILTVITNEELIILHFQILGLGMNIKHFRNF